MNFDHEMNKIIEGITQDGMPQKLLLNSCCGPCSTAVLEQLKTAFRVSVHFCNPNIDTEEEYLLRLENQKLAMEGLLIPLNTLIEQGWGHDNWSKKMRPVLFDHEGGRRCVACIAYRMRQTALLAKKMEFQWFTTTLSVSPHKNAKAINAIGEMLEKELGVRYLYADFKKRNGYKKSIELSKCYQLYRQEYCGCEESKKERTSKKDGI